MASSVDDSSFKMPDVFVVPPAEDQVPVWRCFNAAKLEVVEERSVEVEVEDLQGLLDGSASSKAFSEASKSQSQMDSRPPSENNSDRATADTGSDAYYGSENDEDTQEDHDQARNGQHHALTRFRRQESLSDTGNDSDVVEVVRVSRSHRGSDAETGQQPASPPALKRSSTLKAKASKALRTLTIAFRSSKAKPKVEEAAPSSRPASRGTHLEEEQEPQPLAEAAVPLPDSPPATPIDQVAPRAPTAKLSRRISQIFNVGTIGRSRSATITPNGTSSEDRPTAPQVTYSVSSPTSDSHNTLPSRRTQEHPTIGTDEPPSTLGAKSKSTFSRANLKTLFSFAPNEQGQLNSDSEVTSPSKSSVDSDEDGRTTPTLKRKSSSLPSTSSDSSAGPQTPKTTGHGSPSTACVGPSISESTSNMAHQLEGLGEGDLGILPSEGSKISYAPARQSNSSSDSGDDDNQPPLYRRYSSSSYRSSMESSVTTTVASKPPTLPPIHQLDYMGSTADLVGVHDYNVPAVARVEEEEEGDVSMEMRLDSLHFDSLSFDADQFVWDLEEIKAGR